MARGSLASGQRRALGTPILERRVTNGANVAWPSGQSKPTENSVGLLCPYATALEPAKKGTSKYAVSS